MNAQGPKPRVEYDGREYVCRTYDAPPDLYAMSRIAALMWLNRNTYARGHSTRKPNPLAGLGDAIRFESGSLRLDSLAFLATVSLALVPVTLAVTFVASLAGAVAGVA